MAAGPESARPTDAVLGEAEARALGAWLALAHERAEASDVSPSPATARKNLDLHLQATRQSLPDLTALLTDVSATQRRFLDREPARLEERAKLGRIRRDLGPVPRLAELRFRDGRGVERTTRSGTPRDSAARDAAIDAASLALDLALAGRGDLAERLLSAYAGAADDFELYGVINFYERACALERAAVVAGGSGDDAAAEARRLLVLAVATRRRPLLPPVLVAVGGWVASGKTTLSRGLADRLGAPRIEAEAVRNALLGDRPGKAVHEAHWADSFEPGFEDRVYAQLLRRATVVLESGRPLVIAACFPGARQREEAAALARRMRLPFCFVECRVDAATARARLDERNAAEGHAGWGAIHGALAKRWDDTDALSPEERVTIDTACPLAESIRELESRLPSWPEGLRE